MRDLDGYRFLNPMARDYRGREEANAQSIVSHDLADIARADVVLANCWRASIGTAMEIFHAWYEGKRVIVIAAKPHSPWLIAHAHSVVETIEEAIELLGVNAST